MSRATRPNIVFARPGSTAGVAVRERDCLRDRSSCARPVCPALRPSDAAAVVCLRIGEPPGSLAVSSHDDPPPLDATARDHRCASQPTPTPAFTRRQARVISFAAVSLCHRSRPQLMAPRHARCSSGAGASDVSAETTALAFATDERRLGDARNMTRGRAFSPCGPVGVRIQDADSGWMSPRGLLPMLDALPHGDSPDAGDLGWWDDGRAAWSLLIVDDHAEFRAGARALLDADGFDVVGEAVDGESALEAARDGWLQRCRAPGRRRRPADVIPGASPGAAHSPTRATVDGPRFWHDCVCRARDAIDDCEALRWASSGSPSACRSSSPTRRPEVVRRYAIRAEELGFARLWSLDSVPGAQPRGLRCSTGCTSSRQRRR